MKKTLRKIVPLLLIILIIASIFWYCFVYDREFTRDMLLKQARFQSTSGNPALASWFYDLAYQHSGQDEIVAIELANQFKAVGNYTKAEYTLSSAIADGGTLELYMALCKTYVEQDKLLDAVNMLDHVTDPVVKAQLDEIRPKAPVPVPAPGYYSEYISVTLESPDSTLYYTDNREFPSTAVPPYSDPIQLPAGETTLYALSIADNCLVSPLSVLGYTVGGVIEEVTFQDQTVEQAVRDTLDAKEGQVLYSNDLWRITNFTAPTGAASYEDLSKLTYLESLSIADQAFESLHFLSGLSYLKELRLTGCDIQAEDLNTIAALPMLQKLTLSDCGLSTAAGLEKAQGIAELDLSHNTIRNLEPLSAMVNLRQINLQHNALTSLTALGSLSKLEKLDISFNSVTSLAPIVTCVNLSWLDAGSNLLEKLDAAENLTALAHLNLSDNALSDISMLAGCTNLDSLDISHNEIEDISSLSSLVNLKFFNFAHNSVSQLPNWPENIPMQTINGSYNNLESLAQLKGMNDLTYVYMDYNQITSVSSLSNCFKLVMVNIYGNKVDNVESLTEKNIIVNYDPT